MYSPAGAKFDTLKELKQHMSKTHQLFQCDLCTDHYLLVWAHAGRIQSYRGLYWFCSLVKLSCYI